MTQHVADAPPLLRPYETELGRTESLMRNWRQDSDECRREVTQWDGLRPVVKQRKRAYRRINRRLRSALRTARAATRLKFPIFSSLWTSLRFRWLSLKMNSLRLQIVLIAILVAINRVVFWTLKVVVPLAAVWLLVLLAQVLWESGWLVYFSLLNTK